MPRPLTITPAPFKSSYLTIPPSPFSPQLPISPPVPLPTQRISNSDQAERRKAQLKSTTNLLPPPANPLHWLWQCHRCKHIYQLGVTRRCLDDGHKFCAGTTTVKKGRGKNGRVVRHAACASEFDYQGWKGWGVWRRSVSEQVEASEALLRAEDAFESSFRQEEEDTSPVVPSEAKWLNGAWTKSVVHARTPSANLRAGREYWEKTQAPLDKKEEKKKNCWDSCDYPSECRWGKQFGVRTPTIVTASTETKPVADCTMKDEKVDSKCDQPKTSFEEILLELSQSALGTTSTFPESSSADLADIPLITAEEEAPEPAYLEPLSPTRSQRQKSVTEGETPIVSMDDLLESAKRRKRRSSGQTPSPLGANPPSPTLSNFVDGAALERSRSAPQRGSDDLALEVQKPTLQEKAGVFVKGLVIKKRRGSQSTAGSV